MGRRQMPKGYRQRQRDKQLERWKHFIRREKKKIQKNNDRKGAAVKMQKSDHEVTLLAEELAQAQHESAVYKKAWESEKQVSEAWHQENRHLRQQVKELRGMFKALIGFTALLIGALIGIMGGFFL